MAIVNGQYVPEQLGTGGATQREIFGEYTDTDMSDYSAAALNIKLKQLENQFNLDVWNLNNEYNSPAAQMQRYQDAGLNPNLIYSQQNTATAPGSATAANMHPQGAKNKKAQRSIELVNTMINTARAARETFDYLEYGKDISQFQKQAAFYNVGTAREKANQATLETMWQNYLMGSPDADPNIVNSPRGSLYQTQQNIAEQRYNQLKGIVNMIPDQQARTKVLHDLEEYRLSILQGQNDFILSIDTGLGPKFDSFVQMLCYLIVSRLQ